MVDETRDVALAMDMRTKLTLGALGSVVLTATGAGFAGGAALGGWLVSVAFGCGSLAVSLLIVAVLLGWQPVERV